MPSRKVRGRNGKSGSLTSGATNEINTPKMNSKENELGQEFIGDTFDTQNLSNVDNTEIEIKHEEVDFPHNSTSHYDSEGNSDLETVPKIVNVFGSDRAEVKDANELYFDVFQCERDCETCQKYLIMLSKHVRTTHAPPQPTQDTLRIDPDPPQSHQSSSIPIKHEVEEGIENIDHSDQESVSKCESQSDLDLESGSKIDPQYRRSTRSTRNVRLQGHLAKTQASSDSTTSKAIRKKLPSRKLSKCNECGKNVKHLNIHMRIHSGEKTFKCTHCEKSFERPGYLTAHKRTHTVEKPYRCDVCEKSFSQSSYLTTHKKIHTGVKPYKCTTCEKSFIGSVELTRHKRVHTGIKPFKCDVCEKNFISSGNLSKHKRIHTGVKPFKCEVCEKSFSRSDKLSLHQRTHTGLKPYKCDDCETTFSRSHHLVRHKRSHTGEKPFKCSDCGKSFTNRSNLTGHKRIHTRVKRISHKQIT